MIILVCQWLIYLFLALLMQWFGDAEKLTKALFSFASKLSPVIIFVDEVRLFDIIHHLIASTQLSNKYWELI